MATQSNQMFLARRDKGLPLAVPVQVQCDGFRCLAYRDSAGNWVDFHNGKPLDGKVRIVPPEFEEI